MDTLRGLKKQVQKNQARNLISFLNLQKTFKSENNINSFMKLKFQEVSNDKYLKLYKLESDLVDHNLETLENSIDFTYQNDDLFFGFNSSVYETLKR